MSTPKQEIHLDVYLDRQELHLDNNIITYYEGGQSKETKKRYKAIKQSLSNGYLEEKYNQLNSVDFSELSDDNKNLLKALVNGVTSEKGRGLLGVAFLQLAIKSISPEQSIRLHKGSSGQSSFSWKDGISMRTLNSNFSVKFLKEKRLLNSNKFGSFMTRTLAENYPYSQLYKAEIRGPFAEWISVVDAIEDNTMPAELGLQYLMLLLKKQADDFKELAKIVVEAASTYPNKNFQDICLFMTNFYNSTYGCARAFEVVIHSFMQAMIECEYILDTDLVPLSQMRSANKKHGNVGDIELSIDGLVEVAWDAKYQKPYLMEELDELRDKLLAVPSVQLAGFIVDCEVDRRTEILDKIEDISFETSVEIKLFSFKEWLDYYTIELNEHEKNNLAEKWLTAVVETFALERPEIAPIEEPSEKWLEDILKMLQEANR